VKVTEEAMASELLGKSGNLRSILYYDRKGTLKNLYDKVYPDIRARAEEHSLSLSDHPRSYKVFFHRICAQSKYHFYEAVIPRRCNSCDLQESAEDRLPDVRRRLAVARTQDVLEDIVRFTNEKETLEADKAAGEQHKKRDKHQRKWNVQKRHSGIQSREKLVTIDFFSFLSFDSTMVHTLCFVIEWMEDGVRHCKFVDMPCLDAETNSANSYFIATGWLKLFEDTDEFIVHSPRQMTKYDLITVCCDNAIVSKFHLATLLYLTKEYRLVFKICPFCAHHADSVADGHAGCVKPKGKRLVTKNTTLAELASLFNEVLGEAPLKNTVVYPLACINNQRIDELIYSRFGGRDNIKTIERLRTYGELTTVQLEGDAVGYLTGRSLVGEHQQWPYQQAFPTGYRDQGVQIITLEKRDEHFCQRCAWVHGRPMFHQFASADCLFRAADKKARGRKRKRVEAVVEDKSSEDDEEGGEDEDEGGEVEKEEKEKEEKHEFVGMTELDVLPYFNEATDSVGEGELVVVTGIEGEGHPYHVACVKNKWPGRSRSSRSSDPVFVTYWGHLATGYAPSWKKRGETKERISITRPSKGDHLPFDVKVDAKDIILADIQLGPDRELSKEVRFTLAKWLSSMNYEE
jgi:hypothetical protein